MKHFTNRTYATDTMFTKALYDPKSNTRMKGFKI